MRGRMKTAFSRSLTRQHTEVDEVERQTIQRLRRDSQVPDMGITAGHSTTLVDACRGTGGKNSFVRLATQSSDLAGRSSSMRSVSSVKRVSRVWEEPKRAPRSWKH